MLASQSPGFPMSFVIEIRVAEEISPEALNQAIVSCASRHPLLFSTLDSAARKWCFRPELWPGTRLLVTDTSTKSLRFDLTSQIGLRAYVAAMGDGNCTLAFVFHHACVDGLGAMQFLRDVSAGFDAGDLLHDSFAEQTPQLLEPADRAPNSWAELASSRAAAEQANGRRSSSRSLEKSDEEAMVARQLSYLRRFRRSYGGNRLWSLFQWPWDCVGMLWSFEMLWNRPIALIPDQLMDAHQEDETGKWDAGVGTWALSLNIEATRRVKELAKANRQTLNDRVLECWFRALGEWTQVFAPRIPPSLFRVLVPMNLRRGQVASAANMVAMVNFDRKVHKWRSRTRFQSLLRTEMRIVKWIRGGRIANRFLQVQRMLFGDWPMLRDPERCLTTSVLSNLGDVGEVLGQSGGKTTFAGRQVLGVSVIAPLRPQCHVFLSLFSLAGKLNLNFTWNSHFLERRHVDFLADRLQAYLLTDDPWSDSELQP
jgi:hypothetical protein